MSKSCDAYMKLDKRPYAGEFVGMCDGVVVAHSTSLKDVYEATKKEEYRTYAARIYFNGFATLQRPNGGAGTDTTISESTDTLRCDLYEAFFCCTMRLAEGLWFIDKYQDILYAQTTDALKKDSFGRYFNGDILYAEISPEFEEFAQNPMYIDGHKLFPLVNLYKLKDEEMCKRINQKVIFKD